MMNRFGALILVTALIGMTARAAAKPGIEWQQLKGDHFIIYFETGNESFAKDVLKYAEKYYDQVSEDLGYERYSNFWQWDDRVKIFIYPTQEAFQNAAGSQGWAHGIANYTDKEIYSYILEEGFLEGLLPHEITHLIFRDYVGFKGEIPLWLDEGVAQWEEPAKRNIVRNVMKQVIERKRAFTIESLTQLDIRSSKDSEKVTIFYIQAASVVDFLVRRYGGKDFVAFCRELRDGKSLNEALELTYSTSMRNLNELEEKWKAFIMSAV